MAKKKKDYDAYKNAKDEMRELPTVRAKAERILNESIEQRDETQKKKQER